jgi:hypothetical protein
MTTTLTNPRVHVAKTWNDVREAVEADHKTHFDLYASPKHIRMADSGILLAAGSNSPESTKFDEYELKLSDLGLSQLARKLDIPANYADRLASEDPELLATNVNRWLKDLKDQPLLVRGAVIDGEQKARAFLSNRYGILDNTTYLDKVENAFKKISLGEDLDVIEFWLSESSFHLRLGDKKRAINAAKTAGHTSFIDKGIDFLFAMAHLGNSEVGLLSISFEGGVYRVQCANGLVRPFGNGSDAMRKRHFGIDAEKLEEYVVAKAEEILRSATADTQAFANTQTRVDENPADVIERLVQKHRITQRDHKQIVTELTGHVFEKGEKPEDIEINERSRYDVINAVTATARELAPEARLNLERIATSLFSKN